MIFSYVFPTYSLHTRTPPLVCLPLIFHLALPPPRPPPSSLFILHGRSTAPFSIFTVLGSSLNTRTRIQPHTSHVHTHTQAYSVLFTRWHKHIQAYHALYILFTRQVRAAEFSLLGWFPYRRQKEWTQKTAMSLLRGSGFCLLQLNLSPHPLIWYFVVASVSAMYCSGVRLAEPHSWNWYMVKQSGSLHHNDNLLIFLS